MLFKRSVASATIFSIIFSNFALAYNINAPEASVVSQEVIAALPDETRSGIAALIENLEAIDADDEAKSAAQDFLQFLNNNPEYLGSEIQNFSQDQLAGFSEGLASGARALAALKPIADALGSNEWLRSVAPQLADEIIEECGRRFVGGVDMFENAATILEGVQTPDANSRNLLDDFSLSSRECIENIQVYSEIRAEAIAEVDAYISEKQKELQAALDSGDQEAVERIREEIAQAQEQKRKIESGDDLLALLKFLSGVAGFVAGVAGVVASGGTCVPCYGEMVVGAAAAVNGWNELNEEDRTETVKGPAQRPGIDPNGNPTQEERDVARDRIQDDPNYAYITPDVPGGNFMIAREEGSGKIVVFQITPARRIILDLTNGKEGAFSDTNLLPLSRVGEAIWSSVRTPISIDRTDLRVDLEGVYNGQNFVASIVQNPADGPVRVTIEPR